VAKQHLCGNFYSNSTLLILELIGKPFLILRRTIRFWTADAIEATAAHHRSVNALMQQLN